MHERPDQGRRQVETGTAAFLLKIASRTRRLETLSARFFARDLEEWYGKQTTPKLWSVAVARKSSMRVALSCFLVVTPADDYRLEEGDQDPPTWRKEALRIGAEMHESP